MRGQGSNAKMNTVQLLVIGGWVVYYRDQLKYLTYA